MAFLCATCGKSYKWKTSLYKHVRVEQHAGVVERRRVQAQYSCDVESCEYRGQPRFSSVCTLQKHVRTKHPSPDSSPQKSYFLCPTEGCEFSSNRAMNTALHMRGCGWDVQIEEAQFDDLGAFKSHLASFPSRKYRLSACSSQGKRRMVYECRRSRRTGSRSTSSPRVRRSSAPPCMPFKCISRIFVHQPMAGKSVDVLWIRTHSCHDPDTEGTLGELPHKTGPVAANGGDETTSVSGRGIASELRHKIELLSRRVDTVLGSNVDLSSITPTALQCLRTTLRLCIQTREAVNALQESLDPTTSSDHEFEDTVDRERTKQDLIRWGMKARDAPLEQQNTDNAD